MKRQRLFFRSLLAILLAQFLLQCPITLSAMPPSAAAQTAAELADAVGLTEKVIPALVTAAAVTEGIVAKKLIDSFAQVPPERIPDYGSVTANDGSLSITTKTELPKLLGLVENPLVVTAQNTSTHAPEIGSIASEASISAAKGNEVALPRDGATIPTTVATPAPITIIPGSHQTTGTIVGDKTIPSLLPASISTEFDQSKFYSFVDPATNTTSFVPLGTPPPVDTSFHIGMRTEQGHKYSCPKTTSRIREIEALQKRESEGRKLSSYLMHNPASAMQLLAAYKNQYSSEEYGKMLLGAKEDLSQIFTNPQMFKIYEEQSPKELETARQTLSIVHQELGSILYPDKIPSVIPVAQTADTTSAQKATPLSSLPTEAKEQKKSIYLCEENAKRIFRDAKGHFTSDTPENRKLLLETANNESNFLRTDEFGNKYYAQQTDDGKQIWARVKNGKITGGGINDTPQTFSPKGKTTLQATSPIPASKEKAKAEPVTAAEAPMPPPEDPEKGPNEKESQKPKEPITLSKSASNISHIFRNKEGHFKIDTPENRRLLLETANDKCNFLGSNKHGTEWYAKITENGKQIWAEVRNGEIKNGGINDIPKTWNPETGLCAPTRPNSLNPQTNLKEGAAALASSDKISPVMPTATKNEPTEQQPNETTVPLNPSPTPKHSEEKSTYHKKTPTQSSNSVPNAKSSTEAPPTASKAQDFTKTPIYDTGPGDRSEAKPSDAFRKETHDPRNTLTAFLEKAWQHHTTKSPNAGTEQEDLYERSTQMKEQIFMHFSATKKASTIGEKPQTHAPLTTMPSCEHNPVRENLRQQIRSRTLEKTMHERPLIDHSDAGPSLGAARHRSTFSGAINRADIEDVFQNYSQIRSLMKSKDFSPSHRSSRFASTFQSMHPEQQALLIEAAVVGTMMAGRILKIAWKNTKDLGQSWSYWFDETPESNIAEDCLPYDYYQQYIQDGLKALDQYQEVASWSAIKYTGAVIEGEIRKLNQQRIQSAQHVNNVLALLKLPPSQNGQIDEIDKVSSRRIALAKKAKSLFDQKEYAEAKDAMQQAINLYETEIKLQKRCDAKNSTLETPTKTDSATPVQQNILTELAHYIETNATFYKTWVTDRAAFNESLHIGNLSPFIVHFADLARTYNNANQTEPAYNLSDLCSALVNFERDLIHYIHSKEPLMGNFFKNLFSDNAPAFFAKRLKSELTSCTQGQRKVLTNSLTEAIFTLKNALELAYTDKIEFERKIIREAQAFIDEVEAHKDYSEQRLFIYVMETLYHGNVHEMTVPSETKKSIQKAFRNDQLIIQAAGSVSPEDCVLLTPLTTIFVEGLKAALNDAKKNEATRQTGVQEKTIPSDTDKQPAAVASEVVVDTVSLPTIADFPRPLQTYVHIAHGVNPTTQSEARILIIACDEVNKAHNTFSTIQKPGIQIDQLPCLYQFYPAFDLLEEYGEEYNRQCGYYALHNAKIFASNPGATPEQLLPLLNNREQFEAETLVPSKAAIRAMRQTGDVNKTVNLLGQEIRNLLPDHLNAQIIIIGAGTLTPEENETNVADTEIKLRAFQTGSLTQLVWILPTNNNTHWIVARTQRNAQGLLEIILADSAGMNRSENTDLLNLVQLLTNITDNSPTMTAGVPKE